MGYLSGHDRWDAHAAEEVGTLTREVVILWEGGDVAYLVGVHVDRLVVEGVDASGQRRADLVRHDDPCREVGAFSTQALGDVAHGAVGGAAVVPAFQRDARERAMVTLADALTEENRRFVEVEGEWRQLEFGLVTDDKDALTHLRHAHRSGVEEEDLRGVAVKLHIVHDLFAVYFAVALDESADVFEEEAFGAEFEDGVAVDEDEVVESLQLLSFGKLFGLSPRLLALALHTESAAWWRAVEEVELIEFGREVLEIVEISYVEIVEVFGVMVTLVDVGNRGVEFDAAEVVVACEFVAHGGAASADKSAEDGLMVRFDALGWIAVGKSPSEWEAVLLFVGHMIVVWLYLLLMDAT